MSFITQVTISVVIYFILRVFYKSERSLYISSLISAFSYILIYLFTYDLISILPTIHFMVTGLSLLFLFIAYNEIIILERNILKVKKGELILNNPFPVEKIIRLYLKYLVLVYFFFH